MTAAETKDHARAIAEATAAQDVVELAAIANELLALAATAKAQLAALQEVTQARRAGDTKRKRAQRDRTKGGHAHERAAREQLGLEFESIVQAAVPTGGVVPAEPAEPPTAAPTVPEAVVAAPHAFNEEAFPRLTDTESPGRSREVTACHVTSRDTSPSSPSSSFPPTPPLTTPPASPPPAHSHRGRARETAKTTAQAAVQATAEQLAEAAHRAALVGVLATCTADSQVAAICVVLEDAALGRCGSRPAGWPVVGRALVDFAGRGMAWNPKLFRAICEDLAPPAPKPDRSQIAAFTRFIPGAPVDDRLCRTCDAKPGKTRTGRMAIWHERSCRHWVHGVDIDLAPSPAGSVLDMARAIGLGPSGGNTTAEPAEHDAAADPQVAAVA